MPSELMCDECEGSGRDEDGLDCPVCDGTGFIEEDEDEDEDE